MVDHFGDVFVQRFDSAGQALGAEFIANADAIAQSSSVAMDGEGQFAVTWIGHADPYATGFSAQWYDKAGQPLGRPAR